MANVTHRFLDSCRGFLASALDLLNVHNLEIQHTLFRDCIFNNTGAQYRAHGGAVSIAYYEEEQPDLNRIYPTLNINNCSFINNSAFLPDRERVFEDDQINQALNTNFFEGRGGSLSIVPQDLYANIRGRITNTIFQQNKAQLFGGGVYVLMSGSETSHEFMFMNCTFLQNTVIRDFGGGIHFALLQRNLASSPTRITVMGTRFEENSANFGGGLSVVQVQWNIMCMDILGIG